MKNLFRILGVSTLLIVLNIGKLQAQDDLLDMLESEMEEETVYTVATFKSTRIINSHSIERVRKNQLDFRINHRFGQINDGAYELWGLDNALINFCFEYGINDHVMIGLRRGTANKTYDGSVKFSILRQSTGKVVMPISLSYFANAAIFTEKFTDLTLEDNLTHRMSYTHQILVGKKINENISLQLMPTYVHQNRVEESSGIQNDVFAMGLGGRYKVTRRLAFMYEYFLSSQAVNNDGFYNPLSLGFDLETGGHVFQIFLTISRAMLEQSVLANTTSTWTNGGIYFGFNISRMFALGGDSNK